MLRLDYIIDAYTNSKVKDEPCLPVSVHRDYFQVTKDLEKYEKRPQKSTKTGTLGRVIFLKVKIPHCIKFLKQLSLPICHELADDRNKSSLLCSHEA